MMNWKLTFLLLPTFLTLGAVGDLSAQSAPISPVTANLTIPDTKLLPGVPFDMWIDVANTSDTTVGMGLCADMLVRRDDGESLTIVPLPQHGGRPNYPVLLPEYDLSGPSVRYLELRPHQRQTLTIPMLPTQPGASYFYDPRLSKPGRYVISLRLDYCWPGFVTPQKSLLPPTFLGPVITNELVIERLTPTGTDALAWQRMQELSNGEWAPLSWDNGVIGNGLRKEIRAKYADSNYLPYVVLFDGKPYDAILDAIKRFPSSPVLELLHYSAAIAAGVRPEAVAEWAIAKQSKRPTTRMLVLGREDVKRPCPPGHDCSDD